VIDIESIRSDFPILQEHVYGKPLIYLDNAATTQKPRQVLSAILKQYSCDNGNVHRGVHYLSNQSTAHFEQARTAVADFIHAKSSDEIIFTKGATEGLNLIAHSFGETFVKEGDSIIVSEMEHHSNLVPWIMLCKKKRVELNVIPFDNDGSLQLNAYTRMLDKRVKLVTVNHVSNTLGTVNPIRIMAEQAHAKGIPIIIDGTQAVAHRSVNVQDLDCDFYCFSGHKMYAPTGIGVLYGKKEWLDRLPPYQYGGEMIDRVTLSDVTFEKAPRKFEAGTPNYTGAIALCTAIAYLRSIGLEHICRHEQELLQYTQERLNSIGGIRILGTAKHKAGIISFIASGIHCYDLALLLDKRGIAIRSGNHCTQPIMQHFDIEGTARISFACYNTKQEIDEVCENLLFIKRFLQE
jgi:cysteine desulfurase/selenocysteine lyase